MQEAPDGERALAALQEIRLPAKPAPDGIVKLR
jgi:hypothetical protein